MRCVSLVAILMLMGCSSDDRPVRSATSGDLVVFCVDEHAGLIDSLSREFARQYPEIRPAVYGMPTREAIVHLLNDSVSTICTDRDLNEEEVSVIKEAGLNISRTRIAWDALVMVVNTSNAVAHVSEATIGRIVSGRAGSWAEVPSSNRRDRIEFVSTERNSGLYEVMQDRFALPGESLDVFAEGESQRECVGYVARSERAVTLVSMRAVRDLPPSTRIVPVESIVDSASNRVADIKPTQMDVYTGEYPLRQEIFILTTERRSLTGSGFSTFLLTTLAQKIVQNSGLVPAVIPARAIQITSE